MKAIHISSNSGLDHLAEEIVEGNLLDSDVKIEIIKAATPMFGDGEGSVVVITLEYDFEDEVKNSTLEEIEKIIEMARESSEIVVEIFDE